jgi:hypothetical protein
MAISLTHAFVSGKADGADTTLVQPSNWNAGHTLSMATSRLLGRTTAGSGAVEELTVGSNLVLSGGSLDLNTTLASGLTLVAGSTTVKPLTFQSGALNTSATAGVIEYQGNDFFCTPHATTGRGYIPTTFGYTYDTAGSALGSAIADYFPATSSISLRAGQSYEVEALAYFLKSTSGTVTFTWLASSAPDVMISSYVGSAATGFTTTSTTATPVHGFAAIQTNTTLAHAATASLTSAVYHSYLFRLRIETNAATNIRLRVTSSAGTVTPQPGSYYRVTRLFTSGEFAA